MPTRPFYTNAVSTSGASGGGGGWGPWSLAFWHASYMTDAPGSVGTIPYDPAKQYLLGITQNGFMPPAPSVGTLLDVHVVCGTGVVNPSQTGVSSIFINDSVVGGVNITTQFGSGCVATIMDGNTSNNGFNFFMNFPPIFGSVIAADFSPGGTGIDFQFWDTGVIGMFFCALERSRA